MRVTDLLANRGGKPIISFELFPPRDDKGAANLERALDTMVAAQPDYLSVTFGAGGSQREGSLALLRKLKDRGLATVAYLAGYGMGPDALGATADAFAALGVETLFVVRGDRPRGDFAPHPQAFAHASDMLAFIRDRHDFCLGAAGHPEGHAEAESLEADVEYLKLEQQSGAEYVVTQYFYDNRFFHDFVARCRRAGLSVPVVPGIMPIYSVKLMETLAAVCGATITDAVRQRLAALPPDDRKAVARLGVDLATEQCRELLDRGAAALHFFTMNRGRSVAAILQALRAEGRL